MSRRVGAGLGGLGALALCVGLSCAASGRGGADAPIAQPSPADTASAAPLTPARAKDFAQMPTLTSAPTAPPADASPSPHAELRRQGDAPPAQRHDEDCAAEVVRTEVVQCAPNCTSARLYVRCSAGEAPRPVEPECRCTPTRVPSGLSHCVAARVVLSPEYERPDDSCSVTFRCGLDRVEVTCDGENDGTGTSLCEASRNGKPLRASGNPFPGEGLDVCYAAAAHYAAQR